MMTGGKEGLCFLLLDYILTLAWHRLRHLLSSCRMTSLATGSSVVFLKVPDPECESARSWVYRNTEPFHSVLPLNMTKTVRTIKLQKRRLRSMVCKNWNLKRKTKKKLWIKPQNTLNYGSCCNKPQFSQHLETKNKNKSQLLCSCDYCKQILTKHWQIELV